jgi:phosphonate transport system substrate-binding protein
MVRLAQGLLIALSFLTGLATLDTPKAIAYAPKVLRVGLVPSENMQHLLKNARPLMSALKEALGMQVVPFVATDYTGIIEAMRSNKLDVAFFAPGALVLAEKKAKAQVILKASRHGKSVFYSAIITHRDSGIHRLSDLKGKTFAFVDPTSTSGGIYPKAMLMDMGISPERDFSRTIYAGGHDAAVLAVYNKKVDAAATFSNDPQGKDAAWNQFLTTSKQSSKIVPIAFSKPIPSDNIAVHSQLDPLLQKKIKTVFLLLSQTPKGRKLLWDLYRIDGFVEAKTSDFDPVRDAFAKVGLPIK